MRYRCQYFVFLLTSLLCACGPNTDFSQLHLTSKTRSLTGRSHEPQWNSADFDFAANPPRTWLEERAFAQSIWQKLWRLDRIADMQVPIWQTWYDANDLARVFRFAYRELSPAQRRAREPLTRQQVEVALSRNATAYRRRYQWNDQDFQHWLETLGDPTQQRQIFGFTPVLFNRRFLVHVLTHYRKLHDCFQNPGISCEFAEFPPGSILLKTTWRRQDENFSIPLFPSHPAEFHELITHGTSWADSQWRPAPNAPLTTDRGYWLKTSQNNLFLLAGMHVAFHHNDGWFWSSLWFCHDEPCPLGLDSSSTPYLNDYQMCAVSDFAASRYPRPNAAKLDPGLQQYIRTLSEEFSTESWCSNPYLELGSHNHQTNCIGCHQYAGRPWQEAQFRQLLAANPRRRTDSSTDEPSHMVWSLNFGANALANQIGPIIEAFDFADSMIKGDEL
jgi:hypothetical protein